MTDLTPKERNNRETWLNRATHALRPTFRKLALPLHRDVRVSVGFPLGGFEKIAGQCFRREVSKDRHNEIFVSPLIDDAREALAVLVHELLHAADNCASGHDRTFTRRARALGLQGKPTETTGGALFKQLHGALLRTLGRYPHASLRPSKVKRQGTRLLKVSCPKCGYTCRVTRTWLDGAGAPICPTDEIALEEPE